MPPRTGPARPAAPTLPTEQPQQESGQEFGSDGYDTAQEDDVMLAVPAAPPESLAQVDHHDGPHIRPHIPRFQSLGMRQVIVPILLTVGTVFCIAGVVKLLAGEDSPMHDVGNWLAYSFFGAGAVVLALAVLNILQLRAIIRRRG